MYELIDYLEDNYKEMQIDYCQMYKSYNSYN